MVSMLCQYIYLNFPPHMVLISIVQFLQQTPTIFLRSIGIVFLVLEAECLL